MKNAMMRRYLAEFVGTFGIVFALVALPGTGHFAGSDAGLMAATWVSGLAVLAMIYALGHISAAHFNPAVTLGFAVAGRFPWRYVLPYGASQFAGAQMVGHKDAEVAKRIDIFAGAVSCGLGVGDLEELDLSYAPPFGSPWDAVQVSGQAWTHNQSSMNTEVMSIQKDEPNE